MSTPSDTLPRPAAEAGTGHANFGRLLVAEWTKLRTVRSTIWSLVILTILVLGLAALISFLTVHNWSSASAADRAQAEQDPVARILGPGLGFGQLAICVLGVMVVTSEYSTGMIRSTLLASPHRLRMMAAKCIVFTLLVLAIGEVLGFASYAIGKSLLASKVHTSLSDPYVTRAVVGMGLYLAVLGLFALAIGQLVRHTAGAISVVIGFVLVVAPVSGLLPGNIGKHVSAYLPTNAGEQILQIHPQDQQLLSAWEGFGVFGLWTAVLLALAAWLLMQRDA